MQDNRTLHGKSRDYRIPNINRVPIVTTNEGCLTLFPMDFPTLAKLPPIMTSGRGSLRNKATFDMDNPYNSQSLAAGGSALLDAINRGKVHLAKFILDAGEYGVANTKDFKGKTPLIRACYIREMSTRDKAVKLLLKKGADVNAFDDTGRTALSYACELRCNDIVRILVKNNVDPDIPDHKGNTALIYSAMSGNDTAIDILLRSFRRLGLNIDHINEDGMTALIIAAKHGYIASASILASYGKACLSFRDKEKGWNAEDWARAYGCSTPEVIPFSPNAQLYQIKMSKFLKYEEEIEECDDDDDEDGDSDDTDDEINDDGADDGSRKTSNEKKITVEKDLKQLDSEITNDMSHFKLQDRFQWKRGSLPAIKLSGNSTMTVVKPSVTNVNPTVQSQKTPEIKINNPKLENIDSPRQRSKAGDCKSDVSEVLKAGPSDSPQQFLPTIQPGSVKDTLSESMSSEGSEGRLLSSSKVEIDFESGASNVTNNG